MEALRSQHGTSAACGRSMPLTRQVAGRAELRAALELVHDNYVRCGYMRPTPSGMRVCAQYALPNTRTYIALKEGEVVATVSLFPDSPLRLPMDDLYGPEVDGLRREGRAVAEVGMLADRRRELTRGVDLLLAMMKHVFHGARGSGVNDLLITVNPKHAKFYHRLLRFHQIGETRSYASVRNAPAVLLRLPVSEIAEKDAPNERIRAVFFTPIAQEERVGTYTMNRDDLRWLLAEKSRLLWELEPAQAKAIEARYPGLNLDDLRSETAVA